ncbi:MAG TPA: hypothetical protein VN419_03640 [Humidesulfovibrio sp.]|uniref:hypothetical protein n=1 Tax=Humidesulfovibrio sp. TaxID=2910988 RepID=UPI002CEFCCBF|nr:hypothetical protein [Humidesulfovibrio sp.]HWR03090.1 hypothetical protein [Humidesulfovibrio sp.]
MPRPLPLLRRLPLALLLCALALPGCGGTTAAREAEREAELRSLRERVERLEQEQAQERAKLSQDVDALRSSLDEANQRMAALDGGQPGQAGQAGKSPRAALRHSLNEMLDSARQALERLNQSLDKSLARPKAQEPEPAK